MTNKIWLLQVPNNQNNTLLLQNIFNLSKVTPHLVASIQFNQIHNLHPDSKYHFANTSSNNQITPTLNYNLDKSKQKQLHCSIVSFNPNRSFNLSISNCSQQTTMKASNEKNRRQGISLQQNKSKDNKMKQLKQNETSQKRQINTNVIKQGKYFHRRSRTNNNLNYIEIQNSNQNTFIPLNVNNLPIKKSEQIQNQLKLKNITNKNIHSIQKKQQPCRSKTPLQKQKRVLIQPLEFLVSFQKRKVQNSNDSRHKSNTKLQLTPRVHQKDIHNKVTNFYGNFGCF